ncbi:MAG: transport permease protein [Bryobacteraceae bacterium]|nr:MAG: transport permease protein [Bryobacteraceae bacterium]
MRERILGIVRKEFRQALREPRMRVVLVVPPLLQTILFGFAVNLDVERVKLGWMDLDNGPASRELYHAFDASHEFEVVARARTEREAQELIERGEVQALVRVGPDFSAKIGALRQAPVQLLLDGSNSNTAAIILSHATGVVAGFNRKMLERQQRTRLVDRTREGPVLARIPGVEAERRVWFNPELQSRNYFVPGVIVNVITLVTLMLTAFSIVREKEMGTMEQLMVTPVTPMELMLGKTIPFALIGLFDLLLLTGAALAVFRIPLEGNFLLLAGAGVLFILSTLGAGLFMSTISHTQQQAMMASFFFFQPAFTLSGFAFPIRNMPEPVQWLTYLNPLRYFMEIVRGVFLKGSGVGDLWPQLAALAGMGTVIVAVSARRFHKRLE